MFANLAIPNSNCNISNILQQTAASAERVFEFLEEEEEVPETDNPVQLKNVKGQVNFKIYILVIILMILL